MGRVILVLVGALLGVSCVIGGLYVVLEHTTLVSGTLPPAPAGSAEVVATVNGVAITRQMVESEIKISRLNVAEPLAPLQGENLARAQIDALNQLINRQLILQAAAQQNFRLDEAFVDEQVNLLFGSYGDAALDQALHQAGATRADMHWWVGEIFMAEQFTTEVIMANAAPEQRQQVYNEWLNARRAAADIQIYLGNEPQNVK